MQEISEYNVYIDESGDEGIQRGSKYFILTAVVVNKENDLRISRVVDRIKETLELPTKTQLHWNTIKGFPNKHMIMEQVSGLDITIINVVIDTTCIRLIRSNDIYNYFSGYLYERICWLMQAKNGVANIHLSSRSNLKKKALMDFLASRNTHKFRIDMERIRDIKIIPNGRKKLLQLADCCCSALYQALKYNNETHFKYIEEIYPRFYRNRYGKVISYGIKLVPSDSRAEEVHKLLSFLQSKK